MPKQNSQAIPATAHGFLVSNTLFSTRAMSASWPTHRRAAVTRDVPIFSPKMRDRTPSKAMKENASATSAHVRCVFEPEEGVSLSIVLAVHAVKSRLELEPAPSCR